MSQYVIQGQGHNSKERIQKAASARQQEGESRVSPCLQKPELSAHVFVSLR